MTSGELKRAKREVRRRVLAARDATDPADRERAAVAVADRVLAPPEVVAATTVLGFSSFGSELSTMPLIDALVGRGMVVGLPVIDGADLVARSWRPGEPTTETWFGAREPAGGAVIDPSAFDVIVTPAVAVDRRAAGWGTAAGSTIGSCRGRAPMRCGWPSCSPSSWCGEDLPAGAFDLRVHAIVTPEEVIRCAP